MAQQFVSFLNIVAHPHDESVYRRVLEEASGRRVNFWGDDYGAIVEPIDEDDSILRGRVITWTEIDKNSQLLNSRKLEEIDEEIASIIPPEVGINARSFNYAFDLLTHKFAFEIRDENGKSLAPTRMQRLFQNAIKSSKILEELDELDVYLQSGNEGIEAVFALQNINKVIIELSLPNPDEHEELFRRKFEEEKIKKRRTELTKARGEDSIILSDEDRQMSIVASNNGYVETHGRNEEGEISRRSTRNFPMRVSHEIPDDTSRSELIRGKLRQRFRNV